MKISESLLREYVKKLILEASEVEISSTLNKHLRDIMAGKKEPIVEGEESEVVAEIQQLLIDLGFSVGSTGVDGDFGKRTKAGIEDFQSTEELPTSGAVDAKTAQGFIKAIKNWAAIQVRNRAREEEPNALLREIMEDAGFMDLTLVGHPDLDPSKGVTITGTATESEARSTIKVLQQKGLDAYEYSVREASDGAEEELFIDIEFPSDIAGRTSNPDTEIGSMTGALDALERGARAGLSLDPGEGFLSVTPEELAAAHPGITKKLALEALSSFRHHFKEGNIKVKNKMILTDYTIAGSEIRHWCLEASDSGDINVYIACKAAHGSGKSGGRAGSASSPAGRMSNTKGSNLSSTGAWKTGKHYKTSAGTYWMFNDAARREYYNTPKEDRDDKKDELKYKHKGPGMKIIGLDKTCDNDYGRGVVVHGSYYMSPPKYSGRSSRSAGCISTDQATNEKMQQWAGSNTGVFGYKYGGDSSQYTVARNTDWADSSTRMV